MIISLPQLTDVVRRKGATAGSLDGWGWRELKVLSVAWFDGILSKVEEIGVWPDGLLDAFFFALVPETDGDATPLGQRPLGVLPGCVLLPVWFSLRIDFSHGSQSRFFICIGGGRGLGTLLPWILRRCFLVLLTLMFISFVADVVKSFDSDDRGIWDRVWCSLGLLGWFRHADFEYHAHVSQRFKFAAGLREPWTRDGGIPLGCPLSMMFSVALSLHCCGHLAAQECWSRSCTLIILSVCLGILMCCTVLPGSLRCTSTWSVRSLLLVSVSF